MTHRDPVTVEYLVSGFREARTRFETAKLQRDPEPSFRALFEALAWTFSLDDRLGRPEQPDLRGLRYARHAVHHQWADALELDERGASLPATFPMVFFEWRWRPDLRPPENRKDERFYFEHLAGRPARHTLDAVLAFLESQ